MSNGQGGYLAQNKELRALMEAIKIDQDPNEKGRLGIEQSKAVITLGTGLAADIVLTVKKNDIKGLLGGSFKAIGRFGDDLVSALKILRKFKELWEEIKDWDNEEGQELRAYRDHEIWGAFEERGLVANEKSIEVVNIWLDAMFLTVIYANESK